MNKGAVTICVQVLAWGTCTGRGIAGWSFSFARNSQTLPQRLRRSLSLQPDCACLLLAVRISVRRGWCSGFGLSRKRECHLAGAPDDVEQLVMGSFAVCVLGDVSALICGSFEN